MKCLVLLVILMMDTVGTDVSNRCADQQYSPLCFCRVSYTNSSLIDLFLARLILSQCENSLPIHHCGQSQFNPPSFRLTQLVPQVTNLSHCLEDVNCLHILHSRQHCQQCQLIHIMILLIRKHVSIFVNTILHVVLFVSINRY